MFAWQTAFLDSSATAHMVMYDKVMSMSKVSTHTVMYDEVMSMKKD